MRVSDYYELGRTQPTLDFVDVDVSGDILVFIDPRAIRLLPSTWGDECVSLLQHYFRHVLHLIRDGQHAQAQRLLRVLREPNETHLGYSRIRSRGHALGPESATYIWQALRQSEAVQSGLLEDLEDTILMIPGIDSDIVSDITTNVIRKPLINYTQDTCAYYGIPLQNEVDSGPLWDPETHDWYTEFTELPIADGNKLLLVPKAIVRRRMNYDQGEYFRHYLLPTLMDVELNANSELVQLLKNGSMRVTKKDLVEKYGKGKNVIVSQTLQHPVALERYRNDKSTGISAPLTHTQLAATEGTAPPNWDQLLQSVLRIPGGRQDSDDYERAIEALLTALFYPSLTNPQPQFAIHGGRKRIDITYTNASQIGFFNWLGHHYPSAHIFVECKNYTGEVANPELDQLSGRFSPRRGQVGMLVCRDLDNKNLFLTRCRDTASDGRGFIVPIDDSDLETLVNHRRDHEDYQSYPLLANRFDTLIR